MRERSTAFGSIELLARRLPDARVMKAFNTMYYETLRTEGNRSGGIASCSSSSPATMRRQRP